MSIERPSVPLKNGKGIFETDPRLRDWHVFM